jgi:hypothetical protein
MTSLNSHISFNKLLGQHSLVSLLMIILSVDVLLRVISYNIVSVSEFALTLTILFVIASSKLLDYQAHVSVRTLPLYAFLLYILGHLIYSTVYHAGFSGNVTVFESFIANLQEFRVSFLGYFMVFLYWGIPESAAAKMEKLFLLLLKIFAVYTIFEQVLSMAGMRPFFEAFYKSSGIVSENLVELRSLGMYRVWGLVGSTQLLGLVHLFLFVWLLLTKGSRFWKCLSVAAIVLSTSKTAYFIFVIVLLIYYFRQNKKVFLAITALTASATAYVAYSLDKILNLNVVNFFDSINGFFMIATSTVNPETGSFEQGGAYQKMVADLESYSWLFGKGVTYSYDQPENIPYFLIKYYYLTSDYYIMSLAQQFGLVGIFLFCLVFCYIPFKNVMANRKPICSYILLIFFFASFHYSPEISKLIMMFVCYALWRVYLAPVAVAERGPLNER